ncbi:MAG TPA: hypothetical protein VFF07_16365 [Actinomycetota bacterium]|nr:hypothetical protein [Actinomycetota bacterium]
MQIPKEMVVERIRAQADADTASRAESELPDKIDPENDAELLRSFGLDPAALASDTPGSPGVG